MNGYDKMINHREFVKTQRSKSNVLSMIKIVSGLGAHFSLIFMGFTIGVGGPLPFFIASLIFLVVFGLVNDESVRVYFQRKYGVD